MSDDKIAEIKERHFHDERWRNGPSMLCPQMHDDRAFLLDEDERHRAEIERLRAENDELYKAAGRTRAALSGWILASPGREDEPTHELVAAVVAEAERLRFQRSLRKLRDKP